MKTSIPLPNKEELLQCYNNCKTMEETGKIFGVCEATISKWINFYDIPKKNPGGKNLIDITGNRYGMLVVIEKVNGEFERKRNTGAKWLCKCDCGRIIKVKRSSLVRGLTKSCSCIRTKRLWLGYENISGTYWNRICKGAEIRNLEMSITIEDAWQQYIKQEGKCFFTGINITLDKKWGRSQSASLDRIDNNKGYTKDNIQWVHKDINKMRGKKSVKDFIELCKMVVKRNEE